MRDVWRGRNPLQSGLAIIHLAFPAFHLHYVEIALFSILQHFLTIEHQCQLTASEGVKVRNFKLAYKRNAIIFNQVAFNLQSAHGIGTVQYDEFLAVFGSSLHGQSHGADVGKGAAADILDVIYQYIHVFQHVRRGFAGLPVKRIDGQPGSRVFDVRHVVAGVYITAHAVFGTVECHKIHVRCLMQYVDGGFHPVVHSRRVGNQPDTLALQASETLFFQYFDAGFYSYLLCLHRASAKEAQQGYNDGSHGKLLIKICC